MISRAHLSRSVRRAGYSLVEVLVASGLIATGIAAAVSLSFAMTGQEEAGNNIARAMALQENAARMFRLGMSGSEIKRLLPPDPIVYSLAINEDAPSVTNVGTMERATITLVYDISAYTDTWDAGEWTGGPGGASSRRTNVITVLRPTARAGYY